MVFPNPKINQGSVVTMAVPLGAGMGFSWENSIHPVNARGLRDILKGTQGFKKDLGLTQPPAVCSCETSPSMAGALRDKLVVMM